MVYGNLRNIITGTIKNLHLEIGQGQVRRVPRHKHKLLHFVKRVDTRSSARFEKAIPYLILIGVDIVRLK